MPVSVPNGCTFFLTGLSGAGKSTIAEHLQQRLEGEYRRPATLLDGDVVREMLSSGLSFSRADRELNIRRIGFVAAEVTRHGGICVCAAIAPFAAARSEARQRIERHGRFYEIHVATPLAVCEARDPKGLYRRARRGEIKGFTGIDDPFETPLQPELLLDASTMTVDEEIERILDLARADGLLGVPA
jgi:adenylylsulfate kinase (apsK)